MTLTPSVRAISLCNFPCVTNSFACASFVAISALECLFFLAIAACLRPSQCCRKFIAHYDKGTRLSLPVPRQPGQKSPDDGNHCRSAKLTCVAWCAGTECETCVCGMPIANGASR